MLLHAALHDRHDFDPIVETLASCYRTIAGQVGRLLKPGGHVAVELGFGQEAQVAAIFRMAGLVPRPAYTDLSGVPRALCAVVPD